jgi:hypothetical protein
MSQEGVGTMAGTGNGIGNGIDLTTGDKEAGHRHQNDIRLALFLNLPCGRTELAQTCHGWYHSLEGIPMKGLDCSAKFKQTGK